MSNKNKFIEEFKNATYVEKLNIFASVCTLTGLSVFSSFTLMEKIDFYIISIYLFGIGASLMIALIIYGLIHLAFRYFDESTNATILFLCKLSLWLIGLALFFMTNYLIFGVFIKQSIN